MRTIIYIDGFNLYYGCLKGTPYKWLDLNKLFAIYFPSNEYNIKKIKYFTSEVKYNHFDVSIQERQKFYLEALKATGVKIREGAYQKSKEYKRMARFPYFKIKVSIETEKKTDVNLATVMLNDAWLDKYDCAVLVSNDNDMTGLLKLMKKHHSKKELWLMTPAYLRVETTKELSLLAGDNKKKIDNSKILEACQLPNPVIDKKGNKIYKPSAWEFIPQVKWYYPMINHVKGAYRLIREKMLNKRANFRSRRKKKSSN